MRGPLLALLAAALLAAGCGGGGDDEPSSPADRLEAALPDYEAALAEQSCEGFAEFAHSAVRPPGRETGDPPDAEECRNLGTAYTRLEGFKAQRTKIFSSAALVEGTIDGLHVTLVWVVDEDGRWKQVQAMPPGGVPQIDGQPRPVNKFEANANGFVAAMKAGDCTKVFRLLNPAAPLLESEAEPAASFCNRFRASLRSPERLASELARTPGARPVDLGGTADFRFYRVDTVRDRQWTLILSRAPSGLPAGQHVDDSVLDYYPTGDPGQG